MHIEAEPLGGRSPPGPVPGPAWCSAASTDDIDAHARAQAGWNLEYDQLSAGVFAGRLEHMQLPGVRVVREWCNRGVRQRGSLGRESYGFALAAEVVPGCRFHGRTNDGDALMAGCSDDLDMLCPPDFGLIAMVADARLIDGLWRETHGSEPPAWLQGQGVARFAPARAAQLRALYDQLFADPTGQTARLADPRQAIYLRDALLSLWLAGVAADETTGAPRGHAGRQRLVNRACELALAENDAPLSVLELCRRTGASRRKLNYCFQEILGLSPVNYLRAVRLNRVRRELGDAAARPRSVGDVAARWGFWHLSQFSLDYKRHFGELPSETLRRSRAG